jgi:hypothetical protein
MSNAVINISGFDDVVRNISVMQRSQLKFAASRALNQLGHWLRENEKKEIAQTFNSVVPFTQNSPLYTKSTKENLQITFFLRDTAGKGTPPSVYLSPQVTGGDVYVTGFTWRLRDKGLLNGSEYAAHWATRSGQKLTAGRLTQILFAVGAVENASYRKKQPSEARRTKIRGMYFVIPFKGNTPTEVKKPGRFRPINRYPGIYQNTGSGAEQIIPFYKKPISVPAKYDWSARRIQGLADKQFSVYLTESLAKL